MATNGDVAGAVLEGAVSLNGCDQNWGSIPPGHPGGTGGIAGAQATNPAGRRCLAGPRSCALCSTPRTAARCRGQVAC